MGITVDRLMRSQLYSEELEIRLGKNDKECFKWFLASIVFGARISEIIAKETHRAFVRHGLLTPQEILKAGWDFLVNPIMPIVFLCRQLPCGIS
jgi:hypothetical protein